MTMSTPGASSRWKDKLRIGTSGFSFPDWVGPFYPKGLPRKDFLGFYAREFDQVEINATYYRIPPPRTLAAMAERTPPGFRFLVKANREMTHRSSSDPSVYASFREAVEPLRTAGKLEGVLLQFPFSFHNDVSSRRHLGFLRRELDPLPVWAEFRHAGWNRPPVFPFLRDLGIGFCSVDEPELPGLMPPVAAATTSGGYVRFHGRNAGTWWGEDPHRRYDWNYTEDELRGWLKRLRGLAEQTETTYVFFNNCYMGRAVRGARLLRRLLGRQTALDLGFPT